MTVPEELLSLRREMRELRQRVARAERSNAQLRLRNNALLKEQLLLSAENERLVRENAELKARLDDTEDHKNTLAGMIFKPNTRQKPTMDRPVGGQPGHAAHYRTTPSIDRRIRAYLSRCPRCQAKVARAQHVYTRVVEDTPALSPTVATEYTIEKQRCAACHRTVSATPQDTLPYCRFGANLMIRILTLRYESRLPLNRIAGLLKREHGLSISEGAIQDALFRTERFFGERYRTIATEIARAPRKHADETSWRTKGKNGWAWLCATDRAALYTIEETRGKGVTEEILNGSPPDSLLVVDDYAAYKNLPLKRQSCWAHLLRAAREGESDEARDFHRRLALVFKELSDIVTRRFVRADRRAAHAAYAAKIGSFIGETLIARDAKKVQTRIRNQGTHLIEALLHTGAHLTNNHAERQIRPLAVLRKITGGSRSRRGAETTARNMTIVQTLALQGIDLVDGIRALLTVSAQKLVREG